MPTFTAEQVTAAKVAANSVRYVTIKWADGHQSYSGHNDMKRVELLAAKR